MPLGWIYVYRADDRYGRHWRLVGYRDSSTYQDYGSRARWADNVQGLGRLKQGVSRMHAESSTGHPYVAVQRNRCWIRDSY